MRRRTCWCCLRHCCTDSLLWVCAWAASGPLGCSFLGSVPKKSCGPAANLSISRGVWDRACFRPQRLGPFVEPFLSSGEPKAARPEAGCVLAGLTAPPVVGTGRVHGPGRPPPPLEGPLPPHSLLSGSAWRHDGGFVRPEPPTRSAIEALCHHQQAVQRWALPPRSTAPLRQHRASTRPDGGKSARGQRAGAGLAARFAESRGPGLKTPSPRAAPARAAPPRARPRPSPWRRAPGGRARRRPPPAAPQSSRTVWRRQVAGVRIDRVNQILQPGLGQTAQWALTRGDSSRAVMTEEWAPNGGCLNVHSCSAR